MKVVNMPQSAQEWFDQGNQLKEAGEHREARDCYLQAAQLDPTFQEQAWLHIADCNGRLDCNGLALDNLSLVLTLNPRNDQAWVEKGKALLRLADGQVSELDIIRERRTPSDCHQEAIKCFDQAIETNPRADEAWFQKGCMLARNLNRVRDGLDCLEQARNLQGPWSAMAEQAISFYQRTSSGN